MSIEFNELNDSLSANTTISTTFSVSMWVKQLARTDYACPFTIFENLSNQIYILTGAGGTNGEMRMGNVGHVVVRSSFSLDQWYWLAATNDAGSARAYMLAPGETFSSVTDTRSFTGSHTCHLSESAAGGTEWWNGYIAGFKMWDSGLTQAEIERERWTLEPQKESDIWFWNPFLERRASHEDWGGGSVTFDETTTGSNAAEGPPVVFSAKPLLWVPRRAVASGAITLSPGAVATTDTAYGPTIVPGAITVVPGSVGTTDTAHGPTIVPGAISITPGAVATTDDVLVPTIVLGGIQIAPGVVPTTDNVHAPTVSQGGIVVQPGVVTTTDVAHGPVIALGAISLLPGVVGTSDTAHAPAVSQGEIIIQPGVVATDDTAHAPAVQLGGIDILPAAVATTDVALGPTIFQGLVVLPDAVLATTTVDLPSVVLGEVTLTPGAVGTTDDVHAPTVGLSLTITADAIATSTTVHDSMVVVGELTLSPPVVSTTTTVRIPVILGGATAESIRFVLQVFPKVAIAAEAMPVVPSSIDIEA